jgi:hypothetical protein
MLWRRAAFPLSRQTRAAKALQSNRMTAFGLSAATANNVSNP